MPIDGHALDDAALSRRDQRKATTRRALIAAALRRFHGQGFEATTIDEVCADAGVARRTFFRYFESKEALVFPHRSERLQRFADLLAAAPADESPLRVLRQIAQVFAKEYATHRETLLARQRLIDAVPALTALEREIDDDWAKLMAVAFQRHLAAARPRSEGARRSRGDSHIDLHARVLAGAAIGVIRATMRYWFDHAGRPDLGDLGRRAIDHLEHGFARLPE